MKMPLMAEGPASSTLSFVFIRALHPLQAYISEGKMLVDLLRTRNVLIWFLPSHRPRLNHALTKNLIIDHAQMSHSGRWQFHGIPLVENKRNSSVFKTHQPRKSLPCSILYIKHYSTRNYLFNWHELAWLMRVHSNASVT